MSDLHDQERNAFATRTGRRGPRWRLVVITLAIVTVVAAAVAWWAYRQSLSPDDLLAGPAGGPNAAVDLPQAGDRAVVLVLPQRDADGWYNEDRRLASRGQPGEDLLALMQALCTGPRSGRAISGLPRGTRALAAFVDPKAGTAVVDFSEELVTGHPGGSAAEAATVGSILRTVALNFPQVGSCSILVDGRQVGTLAGHLDLTHPFTPRRWL